MECHLIDEAGETKGRTDRLIEKWVAKTKKNICLKILSMSSSVDNRITKPTSPKRPEDVKYNGDEKKNPKGICLSFHHGNIITAIMSIDHIRVLVGNKWQQVTATCSSDYATLFCFSNRLIKTFCSNRVKVLGRFSFTETK